MLSLRHFTSVVQLVVVVGLFGGALTGCVPPWKQAYLRGEDSIMRARYDDAALAFSESCELDGAASDACVRAKSLRKRAVEDALGVARVPCKNDLGSCLKALKVARSLAVNERRLAEPVARMLDDASTAHMRRCADEDVEGSYQSTVMHARCIAMHEREVGTTAHGRRVSETLAGLAEMLRPVSGGDKVELPYAAVRAGLAQCYAPTPARAALVDDLRGQIVARHRVDLNVGRLDGLPSGIVDVVCGSDAVNRAPVRCGRGRSGALLSVTGALRIGNVDSTRRNTAKSIRYVDHVEQKPNPEHRRIKARLQALQDEHRAARVAADAASNDCAAAERALQVDGYCFDCEARSAKEQFCGRRDVAERARDEWRRAADDEERALRQTDEILRIEHFAEFDFIETRHVWEQPVEVTGRCTADAGFAAPALAATRTVRFEDDSHVGFARARLPEDPLVEPTGSMFANEALQIASSELVTFVQQCLSSFANDPTRCDGSLDCHQRRALYRGEDPVAAALGAFADIVDQARPDLPRFPCRSAR